MDHKKYISSHRFNTLLFHDIFSFAKKVFPEKRQPTAERSRSSWRRARERRHACMTIQNTRVFRASEDSTEDRWYAHVRSSPPISNSFRFTGLIIFALDPLSARFWVTSPPNSRALWTVKPYLLDIAVETLHHHSRRSDVFAQPFVAPFESFYLIIPLCDPPLSGHRRDSWLVTRIVTTFLALTPVPSLWKIGHIEHGKSYITEREMEIGFFF